MDQPDLEYVGFWPRLGASLIDAVLLSILEFPLLYLIYGPEIFGSSQIIQGPADVLISWVAPAVIIVWLWVASGQTPGKMAIGAKIVDAKTGKKINFGQAVVRYIGYFVSLAVLCLGYIWIGLDPKKRGWHDYMATTVVVRENRS